MSLPGPPSRSLGGRSEPEQLLEQALFAGVEPDAVLGAAVHAEELAAHSRVEHGAQAARAVRGAVARLERLRQGAGDRLRVLGSGGQLAGVEPVAFALRAPVGLDAVGQR